MICCYIKRAVLSVFQWNGSTTYEFEIERDFGTDYGICCWYTPQLNFTEIMNHMKEHNHSEPHWGEWFMNISKVRIALESASCIHIVLHNASECFKVLNSVAKHLQSFLGLLGALKLCFIVIDNSSL